jgi:hypothetical protein
MTVLAMCRPAPFCQDPSRRESLVTNCVLDGEAYAYSEHRLE